MPDATDVDDPNTWSAPVMAYATKWAERLSGTTEYPGDLEVPHEDEDDFVELLRDRPFRVYHCTRLLDTEVEHVRKYGLIALTEDFIDQKLASALAAGALTREEAAHLASSTVFANGHTSGRLAKVCVVIGKDSLDDTFGVKPLLSQWGGEAIYWFHGDRQGPTGATLERLGRPTIVSLAADFSPSGRCNAKFWPALPKLFVARLLELGEVCGEAHIYGSIAADEVVDVWNPGDAEYDCHPTLPRS